MEPGRDLPSRVRFRPRLPGEDDAVHSGTGRRFIVAAGRHVQTNLNVVAAGLAQFLLRGLPVGMLKPLQREDRPLTLAWKLAQDPRQETRVVRAPLVVHLLDPAPPDEPGKRRIVKRSEERRGRGDTGCRWP